MFYCNLFVACYALNWCVGAITENNLYNRLLYRLLWDHLLLLVAARIRHLTWLACNSRLSSSKMNGFSKHSAYNIMYHDGKKTMHDCQLLIKYHCSDIWYSMSAAPVNAWHFDLSWCLFFCYHNQQLTICWWFQHQTISQLSQHHHWRKEVFLSIVWVSQNKSVLSWRRTVWPPGKYNTDSVCMCEISCKLPPQGSSNSLQPFYASSKTEQIAHREMKDTHTLKYTDYISVHTNTS